MSRGFESGRRGRTGVMAATGVCSELVTATTTGSAACAQQPHVTHVGGHVASPRSGCSKPAHGSPMTTAERPVALSVSRATMMARLNRRTVRVYHPAHRWSSIDATAGGSQRTVDGRRGHPEERRQWRRRHGSGRCVFPSVPHTAIHPGMSQLSSARRDSVTPFVNSSAGTTCMRPY